MHFLIVEDHAEERELITRRLRRHFADLQLTEVTNADEFHRALAGAPFDLVLTDYEMGWTDGLQVLRRVKELFPAVPVVMFTESGSEETAAEGMREGLSDYILKKHPERLPVAIQSSLDRAQLRRERDQAQRELQRSEERYRIITSRVLDMAYTLRVEPDGQVLPEWDSGAQALTGYTDEELAARGYWNSLVYAEDWPLLQEHGMRLLTGRPDTVEFRIVTRSGEVRWLRMANQPEFDPVEQRVVRIYGGVQDITAHRQADEILQQSRDELETRVRERTAELQQQTEESEAQAEELSVQAEQLQVGEQELREEKDRLAALVNNMSDEVWFTDTEKKMTLVNPAAVREFGLKMGAEEHVEQVVASFEIYRPDGSPRPVGEAPPLRALRGEVVRNQEEIVRTPATGELRWREVNATPVHDAGGTIIGSVSVVRDITERRQAEEALRASQARLEAVFAAVPNVLVEYDTDLRPLHASEAALKALGFDSLGFTRDQVVDQLQFKHLDGSPAQNERLPIIRALRGERISGELYRVCTADQGERIVAIYTAPFYRNGRIDGIVTLWHDLTERRQAEEALQAALAEADESRQLSETRNRINDLLVSSLDVTPVLPQVLAETVRGLGMNYGVLLYRRGESWVAGPVYGLPQLLSGHVFSEQEAELTTWAAQHRQILIVEDVTHDARFQAALLRSYGVRSFMAVPLILQERVVGALLLGSAEVVHFRPAQLDSARKVAYGLALAQENARLYEQAHKDAETRATLLREVNHRVKNNLAAIVGLLYAQLESPAPADHPEYEAAIREVVHRIESLSAVHGMLSAAQWAPLRLDELAEKIVGTTLQAVPAGQVSVEVQPANVCVSPDQAHPLALILNELALNESKHVLRTGASIRVTISITRADGNAVLVFRDNGPGYPAEVLARQSTGVGLGLVRSLATRNLRGQLVLRNEAGAVAEIRFPLAEEQSEE